MIKRRRGRIGLVSSVVAMALVAAACGSDEAPAAAPPAPAPEAPAPEAPAPDADPAPAAPEPAPDAGEPDEVVGEAAPEVVPLSALETVCAAGVEEGSFEYWATIEPDNFARIIEPFKDRFPGIDIDFLSTREEDGAGRILTSIAAGRDIEPDLLYGSQDGLFPIISRDLIDQDYDWSQVGVTEDMVHPTNMIRLFAVGLGLAYNTNNGAPEDLPATWEDLIDPQYEGQLVIDPRGNPFDLLAILWGHDAAIDYVTRLAAVVDPIIIRGGTAGMTEVIAGGALMTSSGRADSNAELQADGAPIEMHYTDVVPVRILYNGLVKDAKNPNAAACFAGWLATEEGKTSFESVEFKANALPPAGVPASSEMVFIDSADDAETTNSANIAIQAVINPEG
jgi:iron(III) transport system substrate-binding protein